MTTFRPPYPPLPHDRCVALLREPNRLVELANQSQAATAQLKAVNKKTTDALAELRKLIPDHDPTIEGNILLAQRRGWLQPKDLPEVVALHANYKRLVAEAADFFRQSVAPVRAEFEAEFSRFDCLFVMHATRVRNRVFEDLETMLHPFCEDNLELRTAIKSLFVTRHFDYLFTVPQNSGPQEGLALRRVAQWRELCPFFILESEPELAAV